MGFRRSQSETVIVTLADSAQHDKVDRVLVEPDFSDRMVNALPKPVLQRWASLIEAEDAQRFSA
jgi:hypothetical protein